MTHNETHVPHEVVYRSNKLRPLCNMKRRKLLCGKARLLLTIFGKANKYSALSRGLGFLWVENECLVHSYIQHHSFMSTACD